MKCFFRIVPILLFGNILWAQVPDYQTLITKFQDGIKARDFKAMKTNSEALIQYYSNDYAGYALNGYYFLCRGQNLMAKDRFQAMLQLNPTDSGTHSLMALYQFVMGNVAEAEKHLKWGFQLANYPEFGYEAMQDALVVKETAFRNDMDDYVSTVNNLLAQNLQDISLANSYIDCIGALRKGNDCPAIEDIIGRLSQVRPYNPYVEPLGLYWKGIKDYIVYENAKAVEKLELFLSKTQSQQKDFAFFRASAQYYMATIFYGAYDVRSALLHINRALTEIRQIPVSIEGEAQFLYLKMMYQAELKQEEAALQTSFDLLALAEKLDSDLYRAQASNNIGQYYLNSVTPSERAMAADHIYKALQYAKKGGYPDLENSIRGNYVMVLWQQRRKDEAKSQSDQLFNAYMRANKYELAEVTANNLAFMYYMENNFGMAAQYFKKAVDMTESVKEYLNPKQRLALMNERSSAYSGLVMAYQKLGNAQALFEVQDKNRSRFLRDRLSLSSQSATLQEAQSLLGPDDLLLYYTLSGPGEIIINAITQNEAKVYYNYPIDDWIAMKKQWTDRTKKIPPSYNGFMQGYTNDIVDGNFIVYANKEQGFKASDFRTQVEWTRQLLESDDSKMTTARNAFLKQWYNFALKPVQGLLSNKPNVIISASNELNYLPFEAFIRPDGKYFVESHNIKYIPSVSVWKILKSRNYTSNRKPALVMGGAVYQPSGNVKGSARGMDDFYAISESINKKMANGDYNFKTELQQMGFGGANYLKGTLDEVQYVAQLDSNVKLVTGSNMKESYLKGLSASGELKKYKNLMLSTHGFTVDIIPEFSGVMMSQPNGGDGKEDTFLLAPEIAQLDLEADLAILSACDTGLGALVGGEGINGLNAAFLVAGANNTMLSLWPVNDYSTSLTMQNLFRMLIVDGRDAFTALNAIKRSMASGQAGEQFRAPKYWAPFLLNGR